MATPGASTMPLRRRVISAVLTIAFGMVPMVLSGQHTRTSNVTLMAGVGLTSPLMVDGNGTTVRVSPAATLSAQFSPDLWRAGALNGGILARLASGSLRLRDGPERWSGGRMWQGDLLATASLPLPGGLASLTAGGGLVWLRASRSIAPLEESVVSPAAEATLTLWPSSSAWGLAVTGQGYRLRPSVGRAGGVARLVAGVTHAF